MRPTLNIYWMTACISIQFMTTPAIGQPEGRGATSGLPASGAILSEESRPIVRDFREVRRSQVNPPGHFEGIGHFVFVYYKDEKLCQCRPREVAISPDGDLAIFTEASSGKLMLFRATSRTRKELTSEFVGYPTDASWGTARVIVTLENYENGVATYKTLAVSLEGGV